MQIYVHNATSSLDDSAVGVAVLAIQQQVDRHMAPHWSVSAELHFVARNATPPVGSWVIKLVDTCDAQGALGYHDDVNCCPAGIVGVKTCADDGVSWSSCLSHEVGELVLDPEAVRCFMVGDKVLALEAFDPTESQTYKILDTEVQNFALPSYFVANSPPPWDYMGLLKGPYPMLAPGGYMLEAPVGQWGQVNAEHVRHAKQVAGVGSRRAQRMARR